MSDLIIKEFNGTQVHTFIWNRKPCWIANEVVSLFEYADTSKTIQDCIGAEDFELGVEYEVLRGEELKAFKEMVNSATTSVVVPNKTTQLTIFYEDGLYGFLQYTDKPMGIQFRKWIRRDVLPEIRQTGAYIADKSKQKAITASWRKTTSNIKAKSDLLMYIGVPRESAIAHALTHEELESGVNLSAFKREVRTNDTEKTYSPTEIGKLITERLSLPKIISAIKVNSSLEQAGLQIKNIKGDWELTNKGKPHAKLMPMAIHGKLGNTSDKEITMEKFAIRWRESVLDILKDAMSIVQADRETEVLENAQK